MSHSENRPCWPLALGAAVVAAVLRLIPFWLRPPNFGAVSALSLYAGARLPWYAAFAVPLTVMATTDLILWRAYEWQPFDVFAYAAYAFAVCLGLLVRRRSPWAIGSAAVLGDAVFFLATNFGSWLGVHGRIYELTPQGLGAAYLAALPFVQWTIVSTVVFVPALFVAHAVLTRPAVERKTEIV